MGYLSVVGHSVFALDLAKLRRWSAVRRGVLVAATFTVGALVTDPETGALASVSSLFVGLQDRNASSSYTSRVMLVQSFLFAGVVLVAGVFSEVWVVPTAILAVSAVMAGLAAEHDKAISRMFGDVMPVAAFLGLSTVDDRTAAISALVVLLGGLVQALSARLSVRVEGDLIERRAVAAALVAVADHLADALVRRRTDTGRAAEERLLAASDALASSDLAEGRLRVLQRLLADAEVLRQEAGALRLRRSHDLPVANEDQILAPLATAGAALRATAIILTTPSVPHIGDRKASAAAEQLADCRAAAQIVLAQPRADLTARSLARQTMRVSRHADRIASIAEARSKQRARRVGAGMRSYVRHPSRRDAITGARLGLATIISLGLAALLQVPHGSWVASTAVALLRPDRRALTADTVARALGTFAAVALVLPLVLLTGTSAAADVFTVFLLSVATFVIAQANEGLYVLASAAQVVFTRAAVGEDPLDVAVARIEDVALGSVIAIAFLLLVPISHGRRLARDLAAYADATATWIDAVAGLAAGGHPNGWRAMRRGVRDARVHVQQGLDLRTIEPWGPGLSVDRGSAAFLHIHEVARTTAAVERALKHGEPAGPGSGELAHVTAATLRATGATLRRQGPASAAVPPVPEGPGDPGDALGTLLRQGAAESAAALDAVTSTDAPSWQG